MSVENRPTHREQGGKMEIKLHENKIKYQTRISDCGVGGIEPPRSISK
jgi:hypothetical protein